MIKETKLLVIMGILFFISIGCVCAQDNATLDGTDSVISIHNQNEDALSDGEVGSFTELSTLISTTGANTINLTKDYKYVSGDTVSSDGITINKTITINGNGHTIDGSNAVRIFSVTASNVIFNNITFINANHDMWGGAIFTSSDNTSINYCNFTNNTGFHYGGGVYSTGGYLLINNSNFDSNNARTGGGVYANGANIVISNSNFYNHNVRIGGGAVNLANTALISNSKFENNTANYGGALSIFGNGVTISNSSFKSNKADKGGAILSERYSTIINDSTFESNVAKNHGGAVLIISNYASINNSTFINNSAASGGGVYLVYSERYVDMHSSNVINNSKFISNAASYGGAGLTVTGYCTVDNSVFIYNTAGVYGGAADLTNSYMFSSIFENNSAIFGGALYVQDSLIEGNVFGGNNASVANSIYIIERSTLYDNDVNDSDIYIYTNGSSGNVISYTHDISNLLEVDGGYFAYCAERYNESPYTGVFDNSMEKLRNSINYQPVADYLKILFYQYVDHMQDLRDNDFHSYVWEFTDGYYWNSTDSIVREVINIYNSGFRVSNENACKVLPNGTLMYFNFSSMITPSGQQNLFLFKFSFGDEINQTLTKEALNKTAYIGDYVEYRIVVSNKGTSPVYDVWIEDKDYSEGLIYDTWESEIGEWSYDNLTGQWKLDVLNPSESASIILIFKVNGYGELYNNATSGVGNINVTNSSDDIYVYTPNFTVEKIALNKEVQLGNQTEFQIVVSNIGDFDLHDVFVEEFSFDGLIYDSWNGNEHWNYSLVNGKPRWTYNGVFVVGEISGFNVVFNTTSYGNFTNIVVAGSNETDNKTGNNTTKVLKPDFIVKKNVLTPYVVVGNQTIFEIIVKNTGEVDLDDIIVIEDSYYGLIFDHAVTGDLWSYSPVNGKNAWKLNHVLKPNAEEFFLVYFNTTMAGNFTNYVVATSNKTDNKTGNNTTVVNNTIPDSGNYSNFTVQKITIDKTVLLGELVEFQIIVINTGNSTIHNLTIKEFQFEGLTYHSYKDHFNLWVFNDEEMTWTCNNDFYPGEELGLHVFFNTTSTGTFTNVVVVSSNETDNKTGNNTTKVLKPGINIEKIAINKTVVVGDQVTFEIVVHNTGEEPLSNVTVRELNFDGLIYDHFIDYTGLFYKNADLSWTLQKSLATGEYEGFFVVFNTTKRGNFTNYVLVSTNETDNDTDNDTVQVLGYDLDVSKITLNKVVKIGETVEFEIVVKNTGDLSLENVFVRESKYDSGLVYLNYISLNGNWKHSLDNDGKHRFTLTELLNKGDSASFKVIFNTTQIGNFSNTVEAGYNNTTVVNSTNTTEVVNKTASENETHKNKTGKIKNPKDNETEKTAKSVFKRQIDEKATGNPLLLLLFALILIPLRRFKH